LARLRATWPSDSGFLDPSFSALLDFLLPPRPKGIFPSRDVAGGLEILDWGICCSDDMIFDVEWLYDCGMEDGEGSLDSGVTAGFVERGVDGGEVPRGKSDVALGCTAKAATN